MLDNAASVLYNSATYSSLHCRAWGWGTDGRDGRMTYPETAERPMDKKCPPGEAARRRTRRTAGIVRKWQTVAESGRSSNMMKRVRHYGEI